MILLYVMDIDLNKVNILPVEEAVTAEAPVTQGGGGDIITQILIIAAFVVVVIMVTTMIGTAMNSKADNLRHIIEQGSSSTSTTAEHHANEFNPNN